MKTSRDLMLLAAVAFKNGKFDDAGALFASSLSSEDSDSFLNEVNRIGNPDAENLNIESVSSSATSNLTLSQIAQSLSGAIKDSVESGDEEDEEDIDEEDQEDDEEDIDEEDQEDEEDDESVSTSSGSGIQRRSKGQPQLVISVANSPIKPKS